MPEIRENKYEFRELKAPDLFPMFQLLSKIGIRQFKDCFQGEFTEILKGKQEARAVEAMGMAVLFEIAGIVVQNLPNCEGEIYAFLANVSNLSQTEIQALSLADFMELMVEFVRQPQFKDFFQVVAKLFK